MRTLLIPAAGKASRLRPISNFSSKAMVPINGKPIISYVIDTYGYHFDNIIVIHGDNHDLPKYLTKRYPSKKIFLCRQENPEGPLHAIHVGMQNFDFEGDLTVWLGDTIVTDYQYKKYRNSVTVSKVDDWARWCMIDEDGNLYDKPIDKPPTDYALVGIYEFENYMAVKNNISKIINAGIKIKEEYQISQLLELYKYDLILTPTLEWYDCGDLPSLYESSARLLNKLSRPDNIISANSIDGTITKQGNRCKNEIHWYRNMPDNVKPHVPTIYSTTATSLTMEHVPGVTIQNMLLYEDLTDDVIRFLITKALDMYATCFDEIPTGISKNHYMWNDKNVDRVISYQYPFVTANEKQKYAGYVSSCVSKIEIEMSDFIHGDFHLGNIIFNPSTGKIKMIDPRGSWNDVRTTEGNPLYDFVKFYQSIYGDYIWIYSDMEVDQHVKSVALLTMDIWAINFGLDVNLIKRLVPVMMGSILGFHSDSIIRQQKIWRKTIELIDSFN